LTRFIISFFIFSFLIGLPPVLLGYAGMRQWLVPGFWYIYLFFFIITLLTCSIVLIGQAQNSKIGTQLFLTATIVKLLTCMAFAVIYVLYVPVGASLFILCFFYLYFLNTAFEIYTLLSNLRVQNKK